jgi:hypothetical protein
LPTSILRPEQFREQRGDTGIMAEIKRDDSLSQK